MVGPSRVGKTSLIVSLITDAPRILARLPAALRTRDTWTEDAVMRRRNELEGAVRAGSFRKQALRGTDRASYYKLALESGIAGVAVHLTLLDFPGGWLSPGQDTKRPEDTWRDCREFMAQSTVLLVPVDSPVLMSARHAEQHRAIPELLKIAQVESVAEDWATERQYAQEEPALLLLVPMKCESYFADNGGSQDRAAELAEAVSKTYSRMCDIVRMNAPHARILYCPLDTLGCVELAGDPAWVPDDEGDGLQLSAEFRVRQPGEISVVGAEDILIAVCRVLAEARRTAEEALAEEATDAHRQVEEEAQIRRPFIERVRRWLDGTQAQLAENRRATGARARRAQRKLEHFERMVDELAARPFGSRVREL
ncbi:hypothetical protein GCM10010324_37930 [Streptomyces hiroshimensis]|uniref:ATP/GTP-binding protein n=1 Tax=Streptomyces hiroshimensis TaxID=66424 RepID=A0ABQ2YLS2_9ACTN|nr:hypothetical protein GCM10010324_37930 [Streptomyces hiroshimensis]